MQLNYNKTTTTFNTNEKQFYIKKKIKKIKQQTTITATNK